MSGGQWYFIEKKDGVKIGYMLIPNERGKGYCTEAVQMMVDLFLHKDVGRMQAETHSILGSLGVGRLSL